MNKHFWILIAVILTFTAIDAEAQRWKLRRYEVDLSVGMVMFHGDIGLANQSFLNSFNGMRPSIGLTPRFMITQDMAVSLDLTYLMYGGEDKPGSSHSRVYSFNTNAFQHFVRFEYFLLGTTGSGSSSVYNRRGMVNNYNRVYLYLFAGAGGILSSAKVKDENNGGQEPVDNPGYYPGMQYGFGFPLGGGVKFSLDPRWSVGVELGYQFTTTDKLDGYAPADVSQYNDSYYLLTVKAVYRLRNDKNGRPVFNKYYR